MTLVFDRTGQLGNVPMSHALIVGVSRYSHLPGRDDPPRIETFNLKQLASPALSAWKLCRWLVAHADALAVRLGTIHLLVSPSPMEAPLIVRPEAGNGWLGVEPAEASWVNFLAAARGWRARASTEKGSTTLFYYSGHGLQRFGAPLLTLQDFGDPGAGGTLARSFELMGNFISGMAPSAAAPNIARTQLYFIDACRDNIVNPEGLSATPGTVWDPLTVFDDRATPVFMAAYPGQRAMAIEGEPTDFCNALVQGFDCAAEEPEVGDVLRRYPVTSFTLNRYLENYFNELGTGQYAPATGVAFKDVKVSWLDRPPLVKFEIRVNPDPAVPLAEITLSRAGGDFETTLAPSLPTHPYVVRAPAGIFELTAVDRSNRFQQFEETLQISQKVPVWPIAMQEAN